MSRNTGKGVPPRAIAPGSMPRAPLSAGPPPRLNPQPKPIGPAKGGPPPFGTKPPRPKDSLSLLKRGEKQGGHGISSHAGIKDTGLPDRVLGRNPDGSSAKPVNLATKPYSPADNKRLARVLGKSPEWQKAVHAVAKAPPGTLRIPVTVPVPAGRVQPTLKAVAKLPNGQPGPQTVQRAAYATVVVQKGLPPGHPKHVPGPAKVGYQTMYGEPKTPPGAPKKK